MRFLTAGWKYCMSNGPRFIGSPRDAAGPVSVPGLPHLLVRPSTKSFHPWFHPSCWCRLSRAPSRSPPLAPFRSRAHCRSFVPLRDITRAHPLTSREDSNPRFVPSSGVRNPSTVSSALWLRGFFHPRAASRAHPRPGASPSAQRLPLVEGAYPLAVGTTRALRDLSDPESTPMAPRLRGFVPRGGAFTSARCSA